MTNSDAVGTKLFSFVLLFFLNPLFHQLKLNHLENFYFDLPVVKEI